MMNLGKTISGTKMQLYPEKLGAYNSGDSEQKGKACCIGTFPTIKQ